MPLFNHDSMQELNEIKMKCIEDQIRVLTLDVETTTLDPWHGDILLIAYSYNSSKEIHQVKVYNGEKPDEQFINALADPNITKRGHNCHFDLLYLVCHGYFVRGPIDDTRILAYLENPEQELDLKTLVEKKLHYKVVRMEDIGVSRLKKHSKKYLKNHSHVHSLAHITHSGNLYLPKSKFEDYNKQDVVNCNDLRRELITTDWYKKVEQPLAKILFDAEVRGMQLDIPHFKRLKHEFEERIKAIETTFEDGFNPRSPKQVKERFKVLGTTMDTTDKYHLKQLSWNGDIFASKLLNHRAISKLNSTYITPFIEQSDSQGRLHGRFNQAGRETETYGDVKGTATGRLSSSDPNLQNIPTRTEEGKKIRQGFIATPGMILIDSDLKQIEPRLVAHYTQSKVLLDAFNSGKDTHAIMGGKIFNKAPEDLTKMERFIGKTSWLALFYGAWFGKLKQIVEVNSDERINYSEDFYKNVQESFWATNPELRLWREKHISETRTLGYITTIGGRRIYIPNINSHNQWERNIAERMAVNYQIQGSAADIMKLCIVKWEQYEFNRARFLASIHDEILCEVYTNSATYMESSLNIIMSNVVPLKNVPIEADTKIISTWGEK